MSSMWVTHQPSVVPPMRQKIHRLSSPQNCCFSMRSRINTFPFHLYYFWYILVVMEFAVGLVEKLIGTVARAFYSDTTVIILDILTREAYLRIEEIAPRVKLAPKDVQKVLTLLESEWLIRSEDVMMDDNRKSLCYYIDYQLFVNVVRFRIYHMKQSLIQKESTQTQQLSLQCPTCFGQWTNLEVLRSVSKDHKFVCSNCCPSGNISNVISEPYFRLQPLDSRGKLKSILTLKNKLSEQMNNAPGLHEGIYDLLTQLRNVPLPRNRPSTNIKHGYSSSSTIIDKETLKNIDDNAIRYRASNAGSNKRSVPASSGVTTNKDVLGRKLVIEFSGSSDSNGLSNSNRNVEEKAPSTDMNVEQVSKKPRLGLVDSSAPEFLMNSGVRGTKEVVETVLQMQEERKALLAKGASEGAMPVEVEDLNEQDDDEEDDTEWTS